MTEKRARLAARRQKATASLARRAPRDWPFASVVMPTTPDRLHFAERGAASRFFIDRGNNDAFR